MSGIKGKQINTQNQDMGRSNDTDIAFLLGNTGSLPCKIPIPTVRENETIHLHRTSSGWEIKKNEFGNYQWPITGRWRLQLNKSTGFSIRGPYDRDHNRYSATGIDKFVNNYRSTGYVFPTRSRIRHVKMISRKYNSTGYINIQIRFRALKLNLTSAPATLPSRELYVSSFITLTGRQEQKELELSDLDWVIEPDEMVSIEIFRQDGDNAPSTEYVVCMGAIGWDAIT